MERRFLPKSVYPVIFTLVCAFVVLLAMQHREDDTRFMLGGRETIGKTEAAKNPPNQRWSVIQELSQTSSIDIIAYPSYWTISDSRTIAEIVSALQASSYVADSAYRRSEPDAKLYFKKADGYIMAGVLYAKERVLSSPEGPIVLLDPEAIAAIKENMK